MWKSVLSLLVTTGFLGTSLEGCGPDPKEDDEGGLLCEAPKQYCGTDPQGQPICADLQNDPMHCGLCHADCRTSEANGCVEGQCACIGTVRLSDPCDPPTLCLADTGQCVLPDMRGRTCGSEGDPPCDQEAGMHCLGGHCTTPNCDAEEDCDGLDNDCDGHTDALGPSPGEEVPLQRLCYTGPDPLQDGVGVCHHGQQVCALGGWGACQGEALPMLESGVLRCDGLDNDCDGCIDNRIDEQGQAVCGPFNARRTDVIFVIDRSGSMVEVISGIVSGIRAWVEQIGTDPNIRFGLIDPTDVEDTIDGVSVRVPLSDAATFSAEVAGMAANGANREPMHYAAELALDGTFDAQLHANPQAGRFLIVIHDEPIDAENAVPGYNETTVCAYVPGSGTLAVIVPPFRYQEWDACTSDTGAPPTAFPLVGDPGTILADLNRLQVPSDCHP